MDELTALELFGVWAILILTWVIQWVVCWIYREMVAMKEPIMIIFILLLEMLAIGLTISDINLILNAVNT